MHVKSVLSLMTLMLCNPFNRIISNWRKHECFEYFDLLGSFPRICGARFGEAVDLSGTLFSHSVPFSSLRHFLPFLYILHIVHICVMPPQKHVAEVPRSILPRLTWNSSSSRPTVSYHHSALATRRQQLPQGRSPLNQQIHSLTSSQASRAYSTSIRDSRFASTVIRQYSAPVATRPSPGSFGSPIRHNGVYVAAFKPAQRAFHATPIRPRDHHFDTLKFVKRLQAEGFSEEQAVAMMRVLNDIIQESIQNLTRTMVLREGW